MSAELRALVAKDVQAGNALAVFNLLQSELDVDGVIRAIASELGGTLSMGQVFAYAAEFELIERATLDRLQARGRLRYLGAQEQTLKTTGLRAAEARLKIQREAGKVLDSLPRDKGGRPSQDQDEMPTSPRRFAREEMGLDRAEASHLVALGAAPQEKFDAYIDKVRNGERPPKTISSIVRKVDGGGFSSDEYYTPRVWLEAALRALEVEQFSCDPFSCLAAQAGLVKAARWYGLATKLDAEGKPGVCRTEREDNLAEPLGITSEEMTSAIAAWSGADGLLGDWGGAWWCNPPYSSDLVDKVHAKIREERDAGTRGVLLINADSSKRDQQELLGTAVSGWPKGRISFWSPTGKQLVGNRFAQVVFGININPDVFARAFEGLATATMPVLGVES